MSINPLNNHKNNLLNTFKTTKNNVGTTLLDCVNSKCIPPLKNFNFYNTQKLENYYIKVSKYKEAKRKQFAKNKWFINNKTGQLIKMQVKALEDSLDFEAKRILFGVQQIQHINNDKSALFLTLTLPPIYHAKKNGKINRNFNDKSIQKGYRNLQQTLDIIRRKLNKRGIKVAYVKVVEPHKDLTPHLHIQYWVEPQEVDKFKQYIKNTVHNQIKKNILGVEYDLAEVEKNDTTNISAYITKYLLKTIDNAKHTNKIRIIDGWKRDNRIRMFSTSRVSLPLRFYTKIIDLVEDKGDYENLAAFAVDNITYIQHLNNKTKIKNKGKHRLIIEEAVEVEEVQEYEEYDRREVMDWVEECIKGHKVQDLMAFKAEAKYKLRYKKIYTKTFKDFKLKTNSQDWKMLQIDEEMDLDFFGTKKTSKVVARVIKTPEKQLIYNLINKIEYDSLPLGVC